jgi:tetratricopeptide (TPR) repeat protein
LHYYSEARTFAKANDFYPEIHEASTCLLNMHFYRGEYVSALAVCLDGLDLAEKKNDLAREANYYNLLGFIYRNMNKHADSENAYRQYFMLAARSGDSLLVASAHMEMAEVFTRKQEYDSSLQYLFNAYELYSGNNERHRRAYIHYLVSQTYKAAGQTDSAFHYVMRAIDYTRLVPANKYDVSRYYIAAGELLVQQQAYDKALLLLDTGLRIAQEILHHENMRDAFRFLSLAHAGKKDFDNAYRFQSRYMTLKDSLLNEKNLRNIAELQALYALEKKDREIDFLNQRDVLREAETRQESRIRNLTLGIVALLALTGFLFYNRYRLRQKNPLPAAAEERVPANDQPPAE